jgi:hypothetical protein
MDERQRTHASRRFWSEVALSFALPLARSCCFFWFFARASSRWLPPARVRSALERANKTRTAARTRHGVEDGRKREGKKAATRARV